MKTQLEVLLGKEVAKSHAPVTGYFIACVLVTEQGMYTEHNYEYTSSLLFEHAEQRALKKAMETEFSPRIQKIYMFGKGKVKKFKHYVPCSACSDSLKPYTSQKTEIELLPLDENTPGITFNFNEIFESYASKDYSKITGPTELEEKSLLNKKDRQFVEELILLGQNNGATFFLTGSASGRGGFSNFLLKKLGISYGDIDLFCVLSDRKRLNQIIVSIEDLMQKYYGTLGKVVREVPSYQNRAGVVLKKIYYHTDTAEEPFVDLTFSLKLQGAFIRKEYYERNWFHELA